jgi:hypothetical protein
MTRPVVRFRLKADDRSCLGERRLPSNVDDTLANSVGPLKFRLRGVSLMKVVSRRAVIDHASDRSTDGTKPTVGGVERSAPRRYRTR